MHHVSDTASVCKCILNDKVRWCRCEKVYEVIEALTQLYSGQLCLYGVTKYIYDFHTIATGGELKLQVGSVYASYYMMRLGFTLPP